MSATTSTGCGSWPLLSSSGDDWQISDLTVSLILLLPYRSSEQLIRQLLHNKINEEVSQ